MEKAREAFNFKEKAEARRAPTTVAGSSEAIAKVLNSRSDWSLIQSFLTRLPRDLFQFVRRAGVE